jgi:hypothetical protein
MRLPVNFFARRPDIQAQGFAWVKRLPAVRKD